MLRASIEIAIQGAGAINILFDSTIEQTLAIAMNQSENITVFARLPKNFTIPTPLGTYNPDWAIARETGSGSKVYLVLECRGHLLNLRGSEKHQIRRRDRHFESLGVPFIKATGIKQRTAD